jgi:hypothetical protein
MNKGLIMTGVVFIVVLLAIISIIIIITIHGSGAVCPIKGPNPSMPGIDVVMSDGKTCTFGPNQYFPLKPDACLCKKGSDPKSISDIDPGCNQACYSLGKLSNVPEENGKFYVRSLGGCITETGSNTYQQCLKS